MRRRRLVSAEEEARWEWDELSEEEEEGETRDEGDWLGDRETRRGRAKLQVERDRGVDVTERMVRRLGFDWQGVVWGPQGGARRFTRSRYHDRRLITFHGHRNTDADLGELDEVVLDTVPTSSLVHPVRMYRSFTPLAFHFQLKRMLWSTARDTLYYLDGACIQRVDMSVVHDGRRYGKETKVARVRSLMPCSMCVNPELLAVGGLQGDLYCINLQTKTEVYSGKICDSDNAITNSVLIKESGAGGSKLVCCNNDCLVRFIDLPRFVCSQQFSFPWCVNMADLSPDGNEMVVVGDSPECQVYDTRSCTMAAELLGHVDYNFACRWHSSRPWLVTGGEDNTLRVWDARNLTESFAVLKAKLGPVRNADFSPDGSLLYWSEEVDHVHVNSVNDCFVSQQDLDFVGDISGVDMSPDGDFLWIGCSDAHFGGILELETNPIRASRCWGNQCLV